MVTQQTNIAQTVIHAISSHKKIGVEEIKLETDLIKDLEVDSLDLVDIVMDLEDILGVELLDGQIEKSTTVAALIEFVTQKVNQ
ncbi:acyl carrier protein [bacterium]|nr:acyl carrier protein [bacterium]